MRGKGGERYIDGFVLAVPKKKVVAYKKMAREAGKIWVDCGALAFKECKGEDLDPDMQGYPFLPFPQMIKLKKDETVWFSFITYKSKKHRDSVNKKVMKEMVKQHKNNPDHMKNIPFDMKRFAYGGFTVEVSF